MSKLTAALLTLGVGLLVACSDVGFESVPRLTCDMAVDTDCKVTGNNITLSFSFRFGEVDILFVDDNSGSMFVEQRKMADAFPQFFSRISNLFYQIAIITTDVSASPNNSAPRPANGNGAFQDGRFLELFEERGNDRLATGEYIITNSTQKKNEKFRGTIKRPETKLCEDAGFRTEACPSTDERGIYALNMAVDRDEKKFFRPGAHLAVVILTDEDERGEGDEPEHPFANYDNPETFILKMKEEYPTKSVSVHSIMVRPGDSTCLSQQTQYPQNPPGGRPTYGVYGYTYAKLSDPVGRGVPHFLDLGNLIPGHMGSICANYYDQQMGNIGQHVNNSTLNSPKQLLCSPLSMKVETKPSGRENEVQITIDSRNRLTATGPLGVEVFIDYDCPRF